MIVRTAADLPNIAGSKVIILDFETSSGHQKKKSVNPWHHCRVAGTGITTPELAEAGIGYYLPTGHILGDSEDGLQNREDDQLPEYVLQRYLYDVLQKCETVVGHNINYDCHVAANCLDDPDHSFHFARTLMEKNFLDTLTYSKLVDSDRWGYGLKKLSVDWLGLEDHSDPLAPYLKTEGGKYFNQDYGQIPSDICGEYCIQDLITTWKLKKYCDEHIMSESAGVWETEQKITKILWRIERTGMRIDLQRLAFMEMGLKKKLVQLQERIHDLLVQVECVKKYIRPAVNADCFDVLCSHYGLAVLGWTEGSKKKPAEPSFDKSAMKAYMHHPTVMADDVLMEIVQSIQQFRRWNKILTAFVKPYKELHIDGLLHGSFNQVIRTGRMSMSVPNLQQVPTAVRFLISPWDQDEAFREKYVCPHTGRKGLTSPGAKSEEILTARDASQIEFRLIVGYTRNRKALAAYRDNPATDYHQLMADLCKIDRKPAKAINFMLSFSGGKFKTLAMLKDSLDLLGAYTPAEQKRYEGKNLHIGEVVWNDRVIQKELNLTGFEAFCYKSAEKVYNTYHRNLPELKKTSYRASDVVKSRGYLINLYGRVRKLPAWGAHKAFNAVIQSSAADLFKNRMVALSEYLDSEGVLWDTCSDPAGKIKLLNLVHDEAVTSEPRELAADEKLQAGVMDLLCKVEGNVTNFDVPILWDKSTDEQTWAGTKD